jgi:hypothetical protein
MKFEIYECTKNVLQQVSFYLDPEILTVTLHDLCTLLGAPPGKFANYLF